MSEQGSYNELLHEVTREKKINSFESLKHHMSNEILSYFQFDLPKEFDLVDLPKIVYNFRYMKNFSKTISYSKSFTHIREELINYFNYQVPEQKPLKNRELRAKELKTTSFKQVFFGLPSESGETMILEDISDFSLENITIDSLENVIKGIQNPIQQKNILESSSLSERPEISSQNSKEVKTRNQNNEVFDSSVDSDIEKLMKDFNIEKIKHVAPEEQISFSEHADDPLDEAFRILGLGSIKKNLGKTIISKKKKEGLFFDEWVQENLVWVQFLIKTILHIDYLSLKDEAHYLNVVRNYAYSESFEQELKSLYLKLAIDS